MSVSLFDATKVFGSLNVAAAGTRLSLQSFTRELTKFMLFYSCITYLFSHLEYVINMTLCIYYLLIVFTRTYLGHSGYVVPKAVF